MRAKTVKKPAKKEIPSVPYFFEILKSLKNEKQFTEKQNANLVKNSNNFEIMHQEKYI